MNLTIESHAREVLLAQLNGILHSFGLAYNMTTGGDWNEHDARNAPDLAIVVRARDDLAGEGPWALEAPRDDLAALIARVRAGSSLALEFGGRSARAGATLNASDPAFVDDELDIIVVCDALLARLPAAEAD